MKRDLANDNISIDEFFITSDTWNTLWVIQKALNEGIKKDLPVKTEVVAGSVESTISVIADYATIGSFVLAIIMYVLKKRKQEKPIQVIRFNRDTAYSYVKQHLEEQDIHNPKLISENTITDGGYYFEFEDSEQIRYRYSISKNFDVTYSQG